MLGDRPRAREHLASATTTAQREGIGTEIAKTVAAQAAPELAEGGRGSAARARELFGQALDLFQPLGMAGEARRVQELHHRLPRQPGGRSQPQLPGGLTEREAAVLRLIAAGKSNREIADGLYQSVRTVERHITNIYAKIGGRGKADATAYALRHGLA